MKTLELFAAKQMLGPYPGIRWWSWGVAFGRKVCPCGCNAGWGIA